MVIAIFSQFRLLFRIVKYNLTFRRKSQNCTLKRCNYLFFTFSSVAENKWWNVKSVLWYVNSVFWLVPLNSEFVSYNYVLISLYSDFFPLCGNICEIKSCNYLYKPYTFIQNITFFPQIIPQFKVRFYHFRRLVLKALWLNNLVLELTSFICNESSVNRVWASLCTSIMVILDDCNQTIKGLMMNLHPCRSR